MIVRPRDTIEGQYINQIDIGRFESVWVKHGGLNVHIYAGLEGMAVDIFTEPMQVDVGPIDTAFAPWPKG